MADHVIFQCEFVGVLLRARRLRVKQRIAIFRFASLAQGQVSLFGDKAHILKRIGMCHGNPDLERLPGGDTFYGKGIVELEMALALGVGGESRKYNEACG